MGKQTRQQEAKICAAVVISRACRAGLWERPHSHCVMPWADLDVSVTDAAPVEQTTTSVECDRIVKALNNMPYNYDPD